MKSKRLNLRRSLAVAMVCTLAVSSCPAAVFAAEAEDGIPVEIVDEPAEAAEGSAYVLMNIPYDDFYKAELDNNNVKVDAFTSATLNKTRTHNLVAGSYHVDPNGTDITGVTYPVKVSDLSVLAGQKQVTDADSVSIEVTNRGQTSSATYTGKDALFESPSYSYYVLDEAPAAYKELTSGAGGNFSFGPVQGAREETLNPEKAEITTDTSYGDYQVTLTGLNEIGSEDDIYGVVVTTTDGTDYGLRHMENIWRTWNLAWSAGFTTQVHGGAVSSAHYKSMMGKTISSITYYVKDRICRIPVNLYVPIKSGMTAKVSDSTNVSASVALDGAPADYTASYEVDGKQATFADGKLTFAEPLSVGSHTLTVKDSGKKYADVTADFVVSTTELPAAYSGNTATAKIVAADGFGADALSAYLANLASVSVNGKSYAASGRGAVAIVGADGTIDLRAKAENVSVFDVSKSTNVVVKATGYPDLSFIMAAITKKGTLAAPKSVKASAAAYNQIKVSWKKVSKAESYDVYRSTKKGSGYKKIASVDGTSYADATVTVGKTYYYKVKATSLTVKTSKYSSAASAKTKLSKPTGLAAVAGEKQVSLTWKAVAGAKKYYVYRSTKKSSGYKKIATVTAAEYVNKKLTKGKTYYYKVTAVSGSAKSAQSAAKSAKVK